MRKKNYNYLMYCVLGVSGLIILFPVFWALSTSLKPESAIFLWPPHWIPETPTIGAYKYILLISRIPRNCLNSFFVSIMAVIFTLFIGTLAAYRFARFQFPGKNFFLYLFLGTMLVPSLASLIPLYIIMQRVHLLDTLTGLSLLHTAINLPLVILIMKSFIESIPFELDEAALLDGCSYFQAFIRIILPLLKPGLSAAGIIVFMHAWNEFIMGLTFIQSQDKRLVQPGIWTFAQYRDIQMRNLMASCIVASIPIIILFLILQRRFIEGLTRGSVKA